MKQPKISRSHSTQILSDQKPLSLESHPQIKMPQTMKEQVEKSKYKSNEMDLFIGCALILFSFFCFSYGLYSCVISKIIMPKTGNKVLDWIKDDYYYCGLLPSFFMMMFPIMAINWFGMKFFRHG